MTALLAFDTATDHMSIALGLGERLWSHQGDGGAQASATLIPAILDLLSNAGIGLRDLDAIAFGRGPGAFTGLRTACSVAQGLALGADLPVLPIDTLLAVAEDARAGIGADELQLWVAMDARMDEIYAAQYRFEAGHWQVFDAPMLIGPDALNQRWEAAPPRFVAGNALRAFGPRLLTGSAIRAEQALPRAEAMLPLARDMWSRGGAVDPADGLPFYLRDKVAQTTQERDAARALKLAMAQ